VGYLDYTNEWLRDLTRQRRREAAERRARAPTIRVSALDLSPEPDPEPAAPERTHDLVREEGFGRHGARKKRWRAWKAAQWAAGNRRCAYCACALTLEPERRNSVTLDHRHPVVYGGPDRPDNWAMACLRCNGLKGELLEHEFVALLAGRRS
jgi:5-methylcytosine-specific restriction endonuclease McrA